LDERFTELHALLQLTHEVNMGLLLDEVLEKAYETLQSRASLQSPQRGIARKGRPGSACALGSGGLPGRRVDENSLGHAHRPGRRRGHRPDEIFLRHMGDAVNIASRMESSGEAGCIHVTEEIHAKLQGAFVFEERDTIDIKGKGLMKTYFLKAKR
jgi:hypothetical protein